MGVRFGIGLAKVVAALVLALAVFLVGTYFQVRGALPPYSGHVEAAGLKAPVEILRDKNAVPHIVAGSIEDAAFGLGYVHAQDRFWQMELLRRLGQGRLSEVLPPMLIGEGVLNSDRTMRGLGVYGHATDSLSALSSGTRASSSATSRWCSTSRKAPTAAAGKPGCRCCWSSGGFRSWDQARRPRRSPWIRR